MCLFVINAPTRKRCILLRIIRTCEAQTFAFSHTAPLENVRIFSARFSAGPKAAWLPWYFIQMFPGVETYWLWWSATSRPNLFSYPGKYLKIYQMVWNKNVMVLQLWWISSSNISNSNMSILPNPSHEYLTCYEEANYLGQVEHNSMLSCELAGINTACASQSCMHHYRRFLFFGISPPSARW